MNLRSRNALSVKTVATSFWIFVDDPPSAYRQARIIQTRTVDQRPQTGFLKRRDIGQFLQPLRSRLIAIGLSLPA